MEIALAAVADTANVSKEGKLNVVGIFDTIAARDFPYRHSSLVLAFRLRAEYDDPFVEHALSVSLVDEDGTRLWSASAKLGVADIAPGQFSHADQVITFVDLVFPTPGRYHFHIRVDETDHTVPFQVSALKPVQDGG